MSGRPSMAISARSVAVLIFPLALAGALVGPNMVGRAEGCAGASSGWFLSWPGDSAAPIDAVVVLEAHPYASAAPPGTLPISLSLDVELKDPAGTVVPGSVSLEETFDGIAAVFKPNGVLKPNTDYSVS